MQTTKPCTWIACLLVLTSCRGIGDTRTEASEATRSQYERFVALEGDWRIVGGNHEVGSTHSYRTVASGSVVVETVFPGQAHEMVTTIHLDGPELVLTHYCAAGNQPHMVAQSSSSNEVAFDFTRAGNLSSALDAHMHDASYTFVDADHVRSVWSFWEGGEKTEEMVVELERIPTEVAGQDE